MTNKVPEQNKVVQLAGRILTKPRKPETPHERVQRVVRARTGETLIKKPTIFLDWKKEKNRENNDLQDENNKLLYEKLHLNSSPKKWKKFFDNFIENTYGKEIEFCKDDLKSEYIPILRYISSLLYNIATDSEYGKTVIDGLNNLKILERGKLKGDVGIYFFLTEAYTTSDLVDNEIMKCYLEWYNEDKVKNKIGLLISQNLKTFLPIIYSISRGIPLIAYKQEMQEGEEDEERDD